MNKDDFLEPAATIEVDSDRPAAMVEPGTAKISGQTAATTLAAGMLDPLSLEAHLPNSTDAEQGDRDMDVVRKLWDAYQRRAWREARTLFHDDAILHWPVSRERIVGADGIIRVNEIYPEGWTIVPQRFAKLAVGQVLSIVRVDQAPNSFFAVSLFTMSGGRIGRAEEYWSTAEEPPAWRTFQAIPGYTRET